MPNLSEVYGRAVAVVQPDAMEHLRGVGDVALHVLPQIRTVTWAVAVAQFHIVTPRDQLTTQVDVGTYNTHTHKQNPFNGPFSGTTQVSWYQEGKTNLDFSEARNSEWQWPSAGPYASAPRSRPITTPARHHCF